MRQLTFEGYLKDYVSRLSGESTADLKRLAQAARRVPRLREPLALLAVQTGRTSRLAGAWSDLPELVSQLREAEALKASGHLEEALCGPDSPLPSGYGKTWRSFVAKRDAARRDADAKLAGRDQVLSLVARKEVSRYRLAKDLGLNPGNLHAFLAQGNPRAMSLEKVMRMVEYLGAA